MATSRTMGSFCVLAGLFVGTAQADFLLTGTEHLDLTEHHNVGVLHDRSTATVWRWGRIEAAYLYENAFLNVNYWDQVVLTPTWEGVGSAALYGDSRLLLETGEVMSFDAHENSVVDIHGGRVYGSGSASGNSTVNIYSSVIALSDLTGTADSHINVFKGGTVDGAMRLQDNSHLHLSGGHVKELLMEGGSAEMFSGSFGTVEFYSGALDVWGGSMSGVTFWDTNGTVFLHGSNFQAGNNAIIVGDTVSFEGNGGTLSGQWLDGTSWTMSFGFVEGLGGVVHIPEPATIGMLALAGMGILPRRVKSQICCKLGGLS